MTEFEQAVKLADHVLDKPYIDPDGDICMLARQFLRLVEKKRAFELLLAFEHWLSIECLHETSQDVGHCICGWKSEPQRKVGDAVRKCLEHLISVASRTESYALASARLTDYFHTAFEASERLRTHEYMPWSMAGGPEDCKHGVNKGIPCRGCDTDTVRAARTRATLDNIAKAEYDQGLYSTGGTFNAPASEAAQGADLGFARLDPDATAIQSYYDQQHGTTTGRIPCQHEHLNEDGICRGCGRDCRGAH